jgi:putative membrane protein
MTRTRLLARNYNWRMLLIRLVVNMLALLFTAFIVPNIAFIDRRLIVWIALALTLGLLNTLIKPLIQLVTLQFLFASGGLLVVLINAVILLIVAWLFPESFAVSGLFAALVGGAVIGLVSAFLESLLGLTPPIVSEKYPEIRQRVRDRQFYRTQAELARIEGRSRGTGREIAKARVLVAGASGSLAQYVAPPAPVEITEPGNLVADTDATKVNAATAASTSAEA